jgi:hypothetical protein
LKWLSTRDNNDKVQYKKAQAKIRRMVANYRNKFWDSKCLEIQTYLGSKKICLGNLFNIYDYPTVVGLGGVADEPLSRALSMTSG